MLITDLPHIFSPLSFLLGGAAIVILTTQLRKLRLRKL